LCLLLWITLTLAVFLAPDMRLLVGVDMAFGRGIGLVAWFVFLADFQIAGLLPSGKMYDF